MACERDKERESKIMEGKKKIPALPKWNESKEWK